MMAGSSTESLATLDEALAARRESRPGTVPGFWCWPRGRIFTSARPPGQARSRPARWRRRPRRRDSWAMAWALHVLTLVTAVRGDMADALPLFDRALAVTESDPALTDLRLLLQVNQAVALGEPRPVRGGADRGRRRPGTSRARSARRSGWTQAHSALGQLLFETGRWDDALAEIDGLGRGPEGTRCGLLRPRHSRGDLLPPRRDRRGAAAPRRRRLRTPKRLGRRLIGPLVLARSLDREQDGALPEALAVLTGAFDGNTEELEEIEDLLADAVRLAVRTGDLAAARTLDRPGRRPSPPDRRSRTGRRTRSTVAPCWTTTPPGCSRPRNATTTPAGRSRGRRRWRRPRRNSPTPVDRDRARTAFAEAVDDLRRPGRVRGHRPAAGRPR